MMRDERSVTFYYNREKVSVSIAWKAKLTHTSKPTLVRFAKYFAFLVGKNLYIPFMHELAHFDDGSAAIDVNIPLMKLQTH